MKLPSAVAATVIALLLIGPAAAAQARPPAFKPLDSSQISTGKIFDLGAADYNDDGLLDVFTTNHKFDSTLLAGDGRGGFTDAFVPAGLSPTPAFPGYEDLLRDPVRTAPGVYLYASDRDQPRDPFHISTTGVSASGTIAFAAEDLTVLNATNATVTPTVLPDGSSELHFEADPGAQIDVTVEHIDLPIGITIDPPTDPSQIRVGADSVPAVTRQMVLSLRDRHGYGFADFNGDGSTDLFIATGGLGGEILDPFFTGRQNDELLLNSPAGYASAITGSGLTKGTCRGRSVRIADLDGDGDLDIIETCDEGIPQLYLGNGDGTFQQSAGPPVVGSVYRLADLGRDHIPELIAAVGAEIQAWDFTGGIWTLVGRVRSLNGQSPPQTLSLGDLDNDGDLDLLATARGGNTVLLNVRGRLRRRAPEKFGLPERGTFAGSFVDYDNDGDLDLELIPQGLYESVDDSYKRTKQLRFGSLPTGRIGYAITSWPDLNGDGRRDLLSARSRGEFASESVVDVRRNRTKRTGHWLQVDLAGPPGNAQSIGATVTVRTDEGKTRGWVGSADDSRYASGHYRVYLGLGRARRIRKLVARWPDGTKLRKTDFRADRLLRVSASRG